jgi:hypothetical protein
VRVVFIAGQGRSGSTLLERLLGGLPGVCTLGEVVRTWHDSTHEREGCSCGTPFAGCDFWNAIGEHAFGGWQRLDRARMRALLYATARTRRIPLLVEPWLSKRRRALISEWVAPYSLMYRAAASLTGARLITDSSKSPALAFCLRHATALDLRVVHLVRDPRGVAYSAIKHVPLPELDGAVALPRLTLARTALRWNTRNAALALLSKTRHRPGSGPPWPVTVQRVRYEDLLTDPRGTIRAVAAFAGLRVTPADLSYLNSEYAELAAVHSASGNPGRYTSGRVPLRRDDAWRSALPPRQRWLVTAACAPLLAAYRYQLAAAPARGD